VRPCTSKTSPRNGQAQRLRLSARGTVSMQSPCGPIGDRTHTYFRETFDHLVAGTPVVVISGQPTLRCVAFVVFFDVVLTEVSRASACERKESWDERDEEGGGG
jgi:hypothetical protein